jgi:hypothetical protein
VCVCVSFFNPSLFVFLVFLLCRKTYHVKGFDLKVKAPKKDAPKKKNKTSWSVVKEINSRGKLEKEHLGGASWSVDRSDTSSSHPGCARVWCCGGSSVDLSQPWHSLAYPLGGKRIVRNRDKAQSTVYPEGLVKRSPAPPPKQDLVCIHKWAFGKDSKMEKTVKKAQMVNKVAEHHHLPV